MLACVDVAVFMWVCGYSFGVVLLTCLRFGLQICWCCMLLVVGTRVVELFDFVALRCMFSCCGFVDLLSYLCFRSLLFLIVFVLLSVFPVWICALGYSGLHFWVCLCLVGFLISVDSWFVVDGCGARTFGVCFG